MHSFHSRLRITNYLLSIHVDTLLSVKVEEDSNPELSPTNINEEKRESGSAIPKQLLSQRDDDDFEIQRENSIKRSLNAKKAENVTGKGCRL